MVKLMVNHPTAGRIHGFEPLDRWIIIAPVVIWHQAAPGFVSRVRPIPGTNRPTLAV
jgi:hypothetical protein